MLLRLQEGTAPSPLPDLEALVRIPSPCIASPQAVSICSSPQEYLAGLFTPWPASQIALHCPVTLTGIMDPGPLNHCQCMHDSLLGRFGSTFEVHGRLASPPCQGPPAEMKCSAVQLERHSQAAGAVDLAFQNWSAERSRINPRFQLELDLLKVDHRSADERRRAAHGRCLRPGISRAEQDLTLKRFNVRPSAFPHPASHLTALDCGVLTLHCTARQEAARIA